MPGIEGQKESRDLQQEEKERQEQQPDTLRAGQDLEALDRRIICEELSAPSREEATGDYREFVENREALLQQHRERYVENYRLAIEAKEYEVLPVEQADLELTTEKSYAEYVEAKKGMAETLVAAKKAELKASGLNPEQIQTALQQFIATEIFERLVINEEKTIQEMKTAEWPETKKSRLRAMYEQWDNLAPWKKLIATTAVTTGVAFLTTMISPEGFAGLAGGGTALFFTKTFVLNYGSDLFSQFVVSGVDKRISGLIEQGFDSEVEQLRAQTTVSHLEELSDTYQQLLEKKAQKSQLAHLASAVTAVASGRAFGIGMDFLSGFSWAQKAASLTQTAIESGPDVMGRVGEAETLGKPAARLFSRLTKFFRKTDDLT